MTSVLGEVKSIGGEVRLKEAGGVNATEDKNGTEKKIEDSRKSATGKRGPVFGIRLGFGGGKKRGPTLSRKEKNNAQVEPGGCGQAGDKQGGEGGGRAKDGNLDYGRKN